MFNMTQRTTPVQAPVEGFLTAPKALPYARHFFGTREHTSPDANHTVRDYTERFGPIAHMHQVHGNRVHYASHSGLYEECDGIYTTETNLWLAVKTADCVPVLISGPGVIGAAHAGWRGLQAGVIQNTVQAMCSTSGLQPEDLSVAIGPCISQSHYEVESTFTNIFDETFFQKTSKPGYVLMNLPAIARAQVLQAGVCDTQITQLEHCTYAQPTLFNSYRRASHQRNQGTPESYAVQLSLITLQE